MIRKYWRKLRRHMDSPLRMMGANGKPTKEWYFLTCLALVFFLSGCVALFLYQLPLTVVCFMTAYHVARWEANRWSIQLSHERGINQRFAYENDVLHSKLHLIQINKTREVSND